MNLMGWLAVGKGFAGNDTGFDPGIAFPFPALGHQVMFQGTQAPGQWACITVRTQTQIGAEHVAVIVHLR